MTEDIATSKAVIIIQSINQSLYIFGEVTSCSSVISSVTNLTSVCSMNNVLESKVKNYLNRKLIP